MGFAGAYTAQSKDGSAIFHNAAGIAFLKDRQLYLGGTLISPSASFTGAEPFPGPTVTEEGDVGLLVPPNAYYTHPVQRERRVRHRRARAVRPADAVGGPGQLQRPLHLHAGRAQGLRAQPDRGLQAGGPARGRRGPGRAVLVDRARSAGARGEPLHAAGGGRRQRAAGERDQHRIRVQPGRPGQAQRHLEHRPLVPAQGDDRLRGHRQLRAPVDRQLRAGRARARVPARRRAAGRHVDRVPRAGVVRLRQGVRRLDVRGRRELVPVEHLRPAARSRSRPTRGSTRRSRRTTRTRSSTASAWSGC